MDHLPRQRVLDALDHKITDRVPLDYWVVPEMQEKLEAHLGTDAEGILQALGVDVRQFQPDYTGPPLRTMADGSWFDAMGVHRRRVTNQYCTYEEYASAPLGYAEDVADLERYAFWPNIDDFDFEGLSAKIGDAHKTYFIKLETGGLFELAWALRGYEQYLMDMAAEPEIPHYIMGRLTDFYCEYVRRAMAAAGDKYDLVYTYDDVAGQSTLLMSKDMWREMVRPYHVKLNEVIHGCGKRVMYHSCGAVFDLIGELRDLPIDILNPIQPRAAGMDMEKIKAAYGKDLCFHGGIDIQQVLPRGTQDEVRAAVRHAVGTLGRGGGYILTSAHYVQADTPVENLLAMYDEARKIPVPDAL